MTRTSFVLGADLHVEYAAYAGHPQMWGDSYFALEQLTELAARLSVPLVLAGDLFDKPYPDSYSLKRFFERLDFMREAGLGVYYTQGQHELSRRQPWLSLHPWPTHLHSRVRCVVGDRDRHILYGLDYLPADQLREAAKQVPADADVLVCHQVWAEFMGAITSPEGSLRELVPPGVRLVCTGDFHGHRALHVSRPEGDFVALSPGSACLQSVGEDPDKFCFVVNDDLTYRSHPLRGRHVYYSRVANEPQLEAEFGRVLGDLEVRSKSEDHLALPENLRAPMWVVRNAGVASAPRRLAVAAAGRLHLFLQPEPAGPDETPVPEGARVTGLEDALPLLTEPGTAVHSSCLRLARTKDLKEEVRQLVGELLRDEASPFEESRGEK